jgi:hypothetical protein
MFPIKNVLKKVDDLSPLLFDFTFRLCHLEGSGKPGWLEIK